MVVQVGDKVLVYGAGTPWAFAKQITTPEVGDKVDVVTLSDGTKLAMPKIELDLSEYVWVVPEFDTPFNIGDVPFNWGTMPLGAAVFKVTGVPDCTHLDDSYRSWDSDELTGCWLIPISGVFSKAGRHMIITGNSETRYGVVVDSEEWVIVGYTDFIDKILPGIGSTSHTITKGDNLYILIKGSQIIHETYNVTISGVDQVTVGYRFLSSSPEVTADLRFTTIMGTIRTSFVNDLSVPASEDAKAVITEAGYRASFARMNPSYPGFDTLTLSIPLFVSKIYVGIRTFAVLCELELTSLAFGSGECCTKYIAVGDQYVIYNPTLKRLVFCDSGKLITHANWIDGEGGAEIASSSIEFVWDGQGYVYLTSSKTTFSTIQFDDLLQVHAGHGGTLRTIPFHQGDRIAHGDETVSRELTNITRILRSGKNTITLTAKNQDGTKVGFVTAVYVKRNMTKVSL